MEALFASLMALTTVNEVLTILNIFAGEDDLVTRYDALRMAAERAVKNWVKWNIEQVTGAIKYLDGKGYADVYLPPYVSAVTNVWVDLNGHYGQGSTPFPAATLQAAGSDYMLVLDSDDARTPSSKSGILRRTGSPNPFLFPSDAIYARGTWGLSWQKGPYWPAAPGCIKVEYTYGFAPGTIPEDIKLAVAETVGVARNMVLYGAMPQSESLVDYSYNLMIDLKARQFLTVQGLLASYRTTAYGTGAP